MVECNRREGSEGQSLFKRTLLACGQKAFKVFVVWLPRGGKGWQDGPRVMGGGCFELLPNMVDGGRYGGAL